MKDYQWALASLVVIALVIVVLYSKRHVYSTFATIEPPKGYKVTISPPRSVTNTWVTFNGSTLLVPLEICGKWHNDFVLDTGSGRLVCMDTAPCGRVSKNDVQLSYGSMAVSASKLADPVKIRLGKMSFDITMPTAFFANSCTRGQCANILGLMPPESGGTFPHHSFGIIFDGVGGGYFSLYPDPPDNAIALPYTILKGFYTLENVKVVNPKTGSSKMMHGVVDSGTTIVECPPSMDVSQPLDFYTADGRVLLASLKPSDMGNSDAVAQAFPSNTFVFGLPFFRRRHVTFNGNEKRIYIYK